MLGDDHMSVENSPVKGNGGAHSSHKLSASSSSEVAYERPPGKSWAEEVLDADSRGSSNNDTGEPLFNRRSDLGTADATTSEAQQDNREIALEFIDGANEEKFERLVKEDKLKTPFKRRHSLTLSNDESRSNSPYSSVSDADANSSGRRPANSHKVEKRVRRTSQNSSSSTSSSYTESDPATLQRRQKQIDYGKSTAAYERYVDTVPRSKRTRDHPRTPNKYGKYSRRAFDGLVKIWRKQLHYYDPPQAAQSSNRLKTEKEEDASSSESSDED